MAPGVDEKTRSPGTASRTISLDSFFHRTASVCRREGSQKAVRNERHTHSRETLTGLVTHALGRVAGKLVGEAGVHIVRERGRGGGVPVEERGGGGTRRRRSRSKSAATASAGDVGPAAPGGGGRTTAP